MKNMNDMTTEEMKEEIKQFIDNCFDENERFIFISYSHKDEEQVYRSILPWIREGYNIYLDLEFSNRGSDENWVEIMKRRVRQNMCAMAIVYRSEHYYFSMPSFVELLTMRSDETIKNRLGADNKILPIDVIQLPNGLKAEGKDFSSREIKEKYKISFKNMKEKSKIFMSNNQKEKVLLEEGLRTLDKKAHDSDPEKSREEDTAALMYEQLENGYASTSLMDYYPCIARIVSLFFKANDLNGNYKSISDDERNRFSELNIYKVAESGSGQAVSEEKNEPDKEINETEQVINGPVIKEDKSKEKEKTDKQRSSTGDITYKLYGKEYTDNQSDMMFNVFAKVLKKHEEMIPAIIDLPGMNCLSATDYSKKENRGDDMPSYFRSCVFFPIGEGVCVGSSYSMEEKIKKIAALLVHCNEQEGAFEPEDDDIREQIRKNCKKWAKGDVKTGRGEEETYTIYGKEGTGNQSEMMIDALKMLVEHHFDKIEKLAGELSSIELKKIDELKGITYFRNGRSFEYQGRVYSIGTSFSRVDKIKQIQKAIDICGEKTENFVIDGLDDHQKNNTGAKNPRQTKDFITY